MMKFRFDGPKFEFNKVAEAFGRAYRSYRVDGKPKIDPDKFYELISKELIDFIEREIQDLRSAKVQATT